MKGEMEEAREAFRYVSSMAGALGCNLQRCCACDNLACYEDSVNQWCFECCFAVFKFTAEDVRADAEDSVEYGDDPVPWDYVAPDGSGYECLRDLVPIEDGIRMSAAINIVRVALGEQLTDWDYLEDMNALVDQWYRALSGGGK